MLAAVLIAAYVVAGIAYVVGDVGEHVIKQPAMPASLSTRRLR
jgi:hypothetical protein